MSANLALTSPLEESRLVDAGIHRHIKKPDHHLFPALFAEPNLGFGIGIAHGFATLGTIGYEGRFDYAAIGTVSNVASRLCDEAKPGQILISPRVLTKVEDAVKVEPVGEFELKGIRRPLAAYNVVAAVA